jgi:hypothetical protein
VFTNTWLIGSTSAQWTISPDTVNEFARKNILPAFKQGKQWRFRRRDISIFFKKQPKDIRDA